jgi:hypothetical protein
VKLNHVVKHPFNMLPERAIMPSRGAQGSSAWRPRLSSLAAVLRRAGGRGPAPVGADPPSCQLVRFADVGWTDVTSTTALASELLRSIGYCPRHRAVGAR